MENTNEFLLKDIDDIPINNPILDELYYNNTDFVLNVEKSNIEKAGAGIFAYQFIEKDQIIGYYEGQLTKTSDKCVGDYSFSLNKTWYLDARYYPRAYTAMINDAYKSKFKNNCEFGIETRDENGKKYLAKDRKIYLKAIKDIYFGEELFASYGKDYWDCKNI